MIVIESSKYSQLCCTFRSSFYFSAEKLLLRRSWKIFVPSKNFPARNRGEPMILETTLGKRTIGVSHSFFQGHVGLTFVCQCTSFQLSSYLPHVLLSAAKYASFREKKYRLGFIFLFLFIRLSFLVFCFN